MADFRALGGEVLKREEYDRLSVWFKHPAHPTVCAVFGARFRNDSFDLLLRHLHAQFKQDLAAYAFHASG